MDTSINRRRFLKTIGLAATSLTIPGCTAQSRQQKTTAQNKKPNFVFILIDDLGWADVGCYGSSFYETPNIDKLAKEGMQFTNGYAAAPVCSPTRASIMTGKYPARLKVTNFFYGDRRGKLNPPQYARQLPLEELTIAEALKEAGYVTCLVGKWHLGGKSFWPQDQGFDVNIGGTNSGAPKNYFWPEWQGNPPIEGTTGEYLTDRLTDEAMKFLEANKDRAFLLYLSHHAVHLPLQAKKDLVEKYRAKAANLPAAKTPPFAPEGGNQAKQVQDHPVFAAMVESMDQSVGRVTRKLEELGIADNTIVIFTSDNGGTSTAEGHPTSNVPLRAGKGWLYEGGIRVPMIIRWPGVVRPGSVCDQPATSTDFYPTMLEMAGVPPKPRQHIDGVSIVSLLKGGRSGGRKAIYWHYPHYSNQGGGPCGAVRAGDYKLIEHYEDNHLELYNLKKDVSEKTNLADRMHHKVVELHEMLREWRKETDAQMPTPNPDYKPEE